MLYEVITIYGNEASVLVGDFLFAQSFSMMVAHGDLAILKVLSHATTRLAEGEVQQLISTCDLDIEEQHYMTVIRNKTAVLIAAACRVGGILGGVITSYSIHYTKLYDAVLRCPDHRC